MIKSIKIENYKSIQELEVDVGRFNVIIGENGAGKSNFLEALVLLSAGFQEKLNNDILFSRGMRTTNAMFYFSNFDNNLKKEIIITSTINNTRIEIIITNTSKNTNYFNVKADINLSLTNDKPNILNDEKIRKAIQMAFEAIEGETNQHTNKRPRYKGEYPNNINKKIKSIIYNSAEDFQVDDIIIYSPENTALRNFYREGQIEPLGINGEGLLKLLKVMQESEKEAFADVLTCLELFDWFETIDVPKDLTSLEDKVTVKDKYLNTIFDQRSANEGFLFVLFYAALFCSQYTPKIFAIDNIDASFNPKLCTAIIKKLVELAKKYDKQVFVTTHNPAILDGIDLGDTEQKLFVASRNKQGHTRFKTLTLADKPTSSTGEPIRLSEAFLRGYLGGLPKNF